ncbi:MAG: LacI family DNA-binding transcriptional regulator, partial [Anaerolineales bacterium]|nr:LacI family DNA-binding transcriptional regulator [Anaerolineales bacterium]
FVKEVTRQRVQATINQLGYVVSLPARRLSSGQSFTIGLIFHNASWYYIQDVQKGVLETARKFGYHTLMHPCDISNESDSVEVLNLVFQRLVDGLVFTPPADNASLLIAKLQELDIPFVRLSPVDRESPLPYVTTSDEQGAYEMTAYLIALGHRRIGYLQGPVEQQAPHDRFNGYRRALQAAGIGFDPAIVCQGDDHFESGYRAGSALIQAAHRPTAICCNNDEMAAGVVAAVFESGLKVPQDISVSGYDNIPLSRQIWPPLTTVEQPIFEMAEKATTHLIRILDGEDQPGLALELPTRLVIRKSTAPIEKS